jgi:hypothetical protein
MFRNRNYLKFLFQFRLLTRYGSGSELNHKNQFKKIEKNLAFLILIEAALLPRNLLNEGNQFHNFILCL